MRVEGLQVAPSQGNSEPKQTATELGLAATASALSLSLYSLSLSLYSRCLSHSIRSRSHCGRSLSHCIRSLSHSIRSQTGQVQVEGFPRFSSEPEARFSPWTFQMFQVHLIVGIQKACESMTTVPQSKTKSSFSGH